MNDKLRLFFALWPDDVTRSALARLQFDIAGQKTRYRNFHVTLAFLGEQDTAVLPLLQEVLARLDAPIMPLEINRRGHFPRNRIAWAGLQSSPALSALQVALVEDLRAHQISFADQAIFKPHITLARDAEAPPKIQFAPILLQAKQVVLAQSLETEDGIQYDVLASHWLRKA